MNDRCRAHERAIDAAAGGELAAAEEAHIERCTECAARRAATLRMTGLLRGTELPAEGAVALARSALERRSARQPVLWVAPLLSASASVAALILYFGLAGAPGATTSETEQRVADTSDDHTTAYVPSLEASDAVTLPESLQAINGLVFTGSQEEEP